MSIINPFAVLGDVEEDDISTLIAHGASKAGAAANIVRRPPPPLVKKAEVPVKQTDYGRGERGQGRGGRGRGSGRNDLDGNGSIQSQSHGRGSGRNVLDGNGSIQFQNKQTDPYQRSYGGSNGYQRNSGGSNRYQNDNEGAVSNQKNNRGANGYQRNRGNGYQRNYGRDSNGNAVDERNHGSSGRGRVLTEYHESRDSNQIKTRSEQIKSEGQNGDSQVKSEGQNGDGQVKSEGQNGDGQIKSEEQNGDSEGWKQVNKYHGKGYGRGSQTFKDFGNGNHSSGGDRRGYGGGSNGFRNGEDRFNGTRQGPNHEKHEILNNNYEKEVDSSKEGEGDRIEAKEGNHGNKEHEINDDGNTSGLEGNVTVTNKGSNIAELGQGKLAQETRKDADERKRAAAERQNQMTLEEYEQKLLEKRKKLPPLQKTEGKRVVLEKEFESMQRIEKKKDDSHSNKLKAENDKLKRNGSLDKEEKVHKAAINIDEFRQPPRRRWREERAKSEEEIPAEPVEVAAPAPPAPCIEDQLLFPVLGGPPKV